MALSNRILDPYWVLAIRLTMPEYSDSEQENLVSKNYNISRDYFYRMLSAEALRYSEPYNDEEEKVLEQLLKSHPEVKDFNLVVVGSGELWYLKLGMQYTKDYVSIEPLQDIFLNDSVKYLASSIKKIYLINKPFNEVSNDEMPKGPSIYVFFFNILSYVNDPLGEINKIIQQGDIVFISTWNTSNKLARYVRRTYFDFLNQTERQVIVDPTAETHVLELDSFPVQEIKFHKEHKRIKGEITDIVIIYT